MYKILLESEKSIGIHEAVRKIKDHSSIALLKLTFSKGARQYYKLSKSSSGLYFWTSLSHLGVLNGEPPREDDDKTYPSLHAAMEGILTDPCKEQHHLKLFTNLKEMVTWLATEL